MSYIPPHRREKTTMTTMKTMAIKKIENPSSNKLSYADLFKKRREYKVKKNTLKKGWIILTKKGRINSLTDEEIKKEEEEEKMNHINKAMKKLLFNHENIYNLKYEKDGYISEELNYSSDDDEYDGDEEDKIYSSDEYDDEELDIEAEKYMEHINKWASS